MKVLFLGADQDIFDRVREFCHKFGLTAEMRQELPINHEELADYKAIVTKHDQKGLKKKGFDLVREIPHKRRQGVRSPRVIFIARRPSIGLRGFCATHHFRLVHNVEEVGKHLH